MNATSAVSGLLSALHALDLLIVAIILGMAVVGFAKGTIKLALIFLAVIVGFVAASVFYLPVTYAIAPIFGLQLSQSDSMVVGNSISFALINAAVSLLLGFLLFSFFGGIEVTGRVMGCIDKPVGMILGVIAGLIICGILVTLLSVPFELIGGLRLPRQEGALGTVLHDWFTQSWLAGPLRSQIVPFLVNLLIPLLAGHIPPILTGGS